MGAALVRQCQAAAIAHQRHDRDAAAEQFEQHIVAQKARGTKKKYFHLEWIRSRFVRPGFDHIT